MRTKNSVRNILVGVISQVIIVIIGFVSRKIFIITLGTEMLGVNALFTSIIAMLSLTELGIGMAIVCNMYKPLADRDNATTLALMQFYARVYRYIAFIILILGVCITPFLSLLIKEQIDNILITSVFLLFLLDTIVSYFYAHKGALLFADQRNDIVTIITTVGTLVSSIFQIGTLLLTQNFVLYLIIKVIVKLVNNIILSVVANKRYPFLKSSKKQTLSAVTRKNIVSNTRALSLHYIGNYLVNGTDNIIISSFLGVIIVGFYSNYLLIITTLRNFLNQFSAGILASFGNLIASESNEKSYAVFKKAYFINYIIFNFASISLLCLFNPFITLWINAESLLDFPVVALLALNFFITGVTEVLGLVRTSAGLFRPDRYLHILLAAVNLIVSIILVQIIGIFGVFLGTFLCLVIKEISVLPSIVYSNIFKMRVREYYKMLLSFCATTFVAAAITMLLCHYLDRGGVFWFLLQCVVVLIVPNAVAILVYRKRPEYAYMREMIVKKLRQVRNRGREL